MGLRPHQQRIIDQNPKKALLCHEMRTGKSLIAKLWSEHNDRNSDALIICLKQNKQSWKDLCPHARVFTKEEFKKHFDIIGSPSCVVVDEAHFFASPLFFAKKRSQLSASLYELVKKNPRMDVLLLTGTPITNDPASIHTLLTYIGHYIPWDQFQNTFYELKYMPFLPRPAYFPRKNWRALANALLIKHADIVSLSDCVDTLPPVIEEVVGIKTPKHVYGLGEEQHWTIEHKYEQSLKAEEIRRIGSGHRKVIVVCHYTEQIDALEKVLSKDKPVFILDGRTKNGEATIAEAQSAHDCYFIVQAKCGLGWDGYMFGAMIFASMAHRVIDHTQMRARLTSVDHPKPCVYYYLLGGAWDNKIYQSIMDGEDFNPHKHVVT